MRSRLPSWDRHWRRRSLHSWCWRVRRRRTRAFSQTAESSPCAWVIPVPMRSAATGDGIGSGTGRASSASAQTPVCQCQGRPGSKCTRGSHGRAVARLWSRPSPAWPRPSAMPQHAQPRSLVHGSSMHGVALGLHLSMRSAACPRHGPAHQYRPRWMLHLGAGRELRLRPWRHLQAITTYLR